MRTSNQTPTIIRTLAALACLTLLTSATASNGRVRERFDAGWRFRRDALPKSSASGPFQWSWRTADVNTLNVQELPSDLDSGNWRPVKIGRDVFHGRVGFAWYRTDLGTNAKNAESVLHFESVDDNAAVFLNGKLLLTHKVWDDPFDVPLSSAWNRSGQNRLVVLVENTAGQGGIMGSVDFQAAPEAETIPPEAFPDYSDQSWRTVHLPHDYVVEGTFDQSADTGHGSLPVATAWYRKTFDLPARYKGKSIWIDFDGIYRDSTIWLNGEKLGNHKSGYTGFRYDISHLAKIGGRNVLAVRVDPRRGEGWWYEGGGIYRHVWLNVAEPLHIQPWGTFVQSTVQGASAKLDIETDVENTTDRPMACSVLSTVLGPNRRTDETVGLPITIPAGAVVKVEQTLDIADPTLWSIESPKLYRLITSLVDGSNTTDQVETHFGIRTLRYDANQGFFLNGKHVEIQGTCNHQDHAGVGIAIPDSLFEWRIKRLKEMGSNAYRCSHNPPAPELLDACDKLGMIVMDENRHLGDTFGAKSSTTTPYSDMSELRSMVLRDRNHPSIIMWSMCNEEGIQSTPEGARIFSAMKAETLKMDPTRPVTCAMNGGWGKGITLVEDLQGFNYGVEGYDNFHRKFPNMPAFGSETASAVSTRGIYANDPIRGYVSAYDNNAPGWGNTAETAWKPIAERPWIEGGFVWTGFDYKGEPTPYGWPCINSHFGIMDICGFAKDSFYYYQAWWGDKPIVHILPHWNWKGKEGQPIAVWCHSNADRVELFLNGKSLGAKDMPRFSHLEWTVPYRPGELVAKAYAGTKLVATDKVETTGAPVALQLRADRKVLMADGEDVSEVWVDVVDAKGRIVPNADNLVQFTVEGQGIVAGVGNGDPSSHEPDKAPMRHAFNGRCMVLVGATSVPGVIKLTASSPGLAGAALSLQSEASRLR